MFGTQLIKRGISTSAVRNGKRNFRKFQLFNKRGTKLFKQQQMGPDPELPIHSKVDLHCLFAYSETNLFQDEE